MATSQPGRWAKISRVLSHSIKIGRWLLLVLLIVGLAVVGYLLYTILAFSWPIESGFGAYTPPQPPIEGHQREKTLWDWLQLLIIPIVLAVGGFFLNRTERMNAEKAAEQRAKTEREIAGQRAEAEGKIAEKRALDTILETYLDRMTELLIGKQLLKSQPGDEVREVARIRTLTALRRLDGGHNKILTQFLQDAGLIGGHSIAIIDISGADLHGVNLHGVNLHGVNLHGVNLYKANLQEANLEGADLQEANLQEANLHWADLQEANLSRTNLHRAFLRATGLSGANLHRAFLREADLRGAYLPGADLRKADLRKADLYQAYLRKADLRKADLEVAFARMAFQHWGDLPSAFQHGASRLPDANLLDFLLQDASLEASSLEASSLKGANLEGANLEGATMPDGSTHE